MSRFQCLIIRDKRIYYIVRRDKRAKRIKVTVRNTGEVVLTVPFFVSKKQGEKFLIGNQNWLYRKVPARKDAVSPAQARKDYLDYKERARQLARRKLNYFNKFYNLPVQRVAIRNQRTRWGSCSQKGNLNFNYKIIKLPDHLSDYIILHELCHLQEMNHSVRFWELVEKVIPDYKERKKELKKWRGVVGK